MTGDLFDILDLADTAWQENAVCASVDPALWHPSKGGTPRPAIKLCKTCPVQAECLEFAMEWEARDDTYYAWGVYGGLTANQRLRLRAERNRAEKRFKDAIDDEGEAA